MPAADLETVQTLRIDIALQVTRHLKRSGTSQSSAAKKLGIPQPTLSKIANGRVSDLSIELLIRIAVRAGLPITLLTGRMPKEAGAFASNAVPARTQSRSKLSDQARDSVRRSQHQLTPSQRLEAFLEHNQLVCELQKSARATRLPGRITPIRS
jgi:predicted XRE-type DNA-binding protein